MSDFDRIVDGLRAYRGDGSSLVRVQFSLVRYVLASSRGHSLEFARWRSKFFEHAVLTLDRLPTGKKQFTLEVGGDRVDVTYWVE